VPPKLAILVGLIAWVALTTPTVIAQQSPAATAAPRDPKPVEEVTVTATRIELEKRVSKFVYQIAGLENEEGLPRWNRRVCPQVSGLPRDAGEFVLARISEVAGAAGAPIGAENCRPNLFVVVTTDPRKILEGMNTTTRILTFGGAHPSVIDEFIATPRPVRVWYKTGMSTPDGISLGDTDRTDADENIYGPFPVVEGKETFVKRSVIWNFTRLLVVVDQARLLGVSRGQFADYIAMVSLADLKPGARLGDAPTILKLFDGAPQDAPEGMSEWDMAFLKSLYSTAQTSKGQRNEIAHTVAHAVVH
jgi:hypothetical protein